MKAILVFAVALRFSFAQGGIISTGDRQRAVRRVVLCRIEFPRRNGRRNTQIRLGQIGARSAVLQDVRDLFGSQASIYWYGDEARSEAGVVAGRQLNAVPHVQRDAIARL